jgi:hypothetical protein
MRKGSLCRVSLGEGAIMFANRINDYLPDQTATPAAVAPSIPAGFAVCQLTQTASQPLALQLIAQQQAYEQALLVAREDALRLVLGMLKPSVN